MKNFTQVNNSQDILRTLEGLKSRITPFRSRFTLVALSLCTLLLLGGFTTRAWGGKAYYTCTEYEDATTYGDKKKWGDNAEIYPVLLALVYSTVLKQIGLTEKEIEKIAFQIF